ncbi:MAG TPA: hypothetical protein VE994_15780, partial [Terriglobales bacterium]|nr:hypothetical protein [Terriglobales bacterium]
FAVQDTFRGVGKKTVIARYPTPPQDGRGVPSSYDPDEKKHPPETFVLALNWELLTGRGDGPLKHTLASRVGSRRQH